MIHQQGILEDILSRLPAKSIGQFRCVSKTWKSLLSQPHFIKTHLNRTKQKGTESIMLISDESTSLYSVHITQQESDETAAFARKLTFVDYEFDCETISEDDLVSCDGLVLFKDVNNKLLLINPTTREIKELPTSPYTLNSRHCKSMYGLGYDSLADDYKVVRLSYYTSHNYTTKLFADVYYVKSGTWKRVENSPYQHAIMTSGVFVDAYVHWLASMTSKLSSAIVAFNLKEEEYYELPPPSTSDPKKFVFHRLVSIGDCLCMFPSIADHETDIWVMREYGDQKSWFKFTIVDSESPEFRPLCRWGKEQHVVLAKDDYSGRPKLVMYNLKDERLRDIAVRGIPDGNFDFGGAFLESLVSPHCNYEAARQE